MCLLVQNLIIALQVTCPRKVNKEAKEKEEDEEATGEEKEEEGPPTRAQKRARVEDVVVVPRKTITVCCEWKGTLADYLETHKKHECDLLKVRCPLGCQDATSLSREKTWTSIMSSLLESTRHCSSRRRSAIFQ